MRFSDVHKKGPAYGRTHFMETEAFQITRTQQKICQYVIVAVVDSNTTVKEKTV